MNVSLLKERFKAIKQETVDIAATVKDMFSAVAEQLSHETIMFLNSFPKDSTGISAKVLKLNF